MNRRLYAKIAWTGIQNNRQMYVPYLIAGTSMVMVFYIFSFLAASDFGFGLRGGPAMTTMLVLGKGMVGVFSVPFLFYTSSALMRKRKKEFGLYNILGMNKKNILESLFWETIITYGTAAAAGCTLGIVFSKMAELGLIHIMRENVNYRVYVDGRSILDTVLLYGGIYFLIFLNLMRQIRHNSPIELLRSASAGERPPKSRGLLAAAGMSVLTAAYILAASVKNDTQVYTRMFVATPMVIAGTYLLFIAGSVFLCRILQKNKSYYYKPAHFVTVSAMAYRMKRNGAGLASVCILATATLVALVGTSGFYAGADRVIENHYPYELGVTLDAPAGSENCRKAYGEDQRAEINRILKESGAKIAESLEHYAAGLCAPLENGVLDLGVNLMKEAPENGNIAAWNKFLENFVCVRVMSLEDYNRIAHASWELPDGEVLVAEKEKAGIRLIRNLDGQEYPVEKTVKNETVLSDFKLYDGFVDEMKMETVLLVVPDMERFWENYDASLWEDKNQIRFFWEYDVNLKGDPEVKRAVSDAMELWAQEAAGPKGDPDLIYYNKTGKYMKLKGLAGGVLFLAVIISAMFVFAAALILYYKQISEGYEDQRQFSMMRKIGMTKGEIRRGIHSQMFTVFCFPLILAGANLAAAMPCIYQMIKASVTDDLPLLIRVAVVSFVFFAGAYTLMYLLAARVYFQIVNRPLNE